MKQIEEHTFSSKLTLNERIDALQQKLEQVQIHSLQVEQAAIEKGDNEEKLNYSKYSKFQLNLSQNNASRILMKTNNEAYQFFEQLSEADIEQMTSQIEGHDEDGEMMFNNKSASLANSSLLSNKLLQIVSPMNNQKMFKD